jgi:hypothetical protein
VALARSRRVAPYEKANLTYVSELDQLIRKRWEARLPDDVLTGEEYDAGGNGAPHTGHRPDVHRSAAAPRGTPGNG